MQMHSRIALTAQRARKSPSSVRQPTLIQQWTDCPPRLQKCFMFGCCTPYKCAISVRCNAMHCLPRQLRCADPSCMSPFLLLSRQSTGVVLRTVRKTVHPGEAKLFIAILSTLGCANNRYGLVQNSLLHSNIDLRMRSVNDNTTASSYGIKYPYLPYHVARVIWYSHISSSQFYGSCRGPEAKGDGPKLDRVTPPPRP